MATLNSPRQLALVAYLTQARKAAGLTQEALAERLGEYQSFVARLESGQRRIDVVEFLALSDVLGFDPAAALIEVKRVTQE